MPGTMLILKQCWKYTANHWIMYKGPGHRRLHGYFADAGLKGVCYLTMYELSCHKGISKTKDFAFLKTARSVNRDISVKVTQMCDTATAIIWIYICTKYIYIVAAIVCKTQT